MSLNQLKHAQDRYDEANNEWSNYLDSYSSYEYAVTAGAVGSIPEYEEERDLISNKRAKAGKNLFEQCTKVCPLGEYCLANSNNYHPIDDCILRSDKVDMNKLEDLPKIYDIRFDKEAK